MPASNRFRLQAAGLATAAFAIRLGYLLAQPRVDPWFSRPTLDGAFYLDWARSLAAGGGSPAGAYYLAPGYPFFLAGFLQVAGESYFLLYLLQHLMAILAAYLLATVAKKAAGEAAGLAAMAAALLYHPFLYFPSRPVGETLAVLLLAGGLAAMTLEKKAGKGLAGLLLGIASLIRPNFLLLSAVWPGVLWMRRRFGEGILLAGAAALVILPVAVRNHQASGHWVPVSSNGGLTLYHGNGPGAEGVYTPAEGFSGTVESQGDEAVTLAQERSSGKPLDPVEADRWWGREALRTRLHDPAGTVVLLLKRSWLALGGRELGLDYNPAIDTNPLRFLAPLPFPLLLGFAALGWRRSGCAGTGGREVWATLPVLLLMPVLFFVSSRYRLPPAIVLTIPAGAGMVFLWKEAREKSRRAVFSLCLVLGVAAASWAVPWRELSDATKAGALANRASAWKKEGRLAEAESQIVQSLGIDPDRAKSWFNLGVILEAEHRQEEAESAYRKALEIDPGFPEAAGNLSGILIRTGRPGEAARLLEAVLERSPRAKTCWTHLVVAWSMKGASSKALDAIRRAKEAGVLLDPELIAAVKASK